jgi:hypothetical protein
MSSADTCSHCGYRIPHDAAICPGCGRRHPLIAPSVESHPQRRSPLLRDARWARRAVAASGWLAALVGLTALSRAVVALDGASPHVSDDTLLRFDHAGRVLAVATLLCSALAAAAAVAWTRRTARSARGLGVPAHLGSVWLLPGWLRPGRAARRAKAEVDQLWRESSPLVGALARRGSSRRLVSRVVLRWWALWTWLPGTVALVILVAHADEGAFTDVRALAAVAAGALMVASARAFYDVIGVITIAHAHAHDQLRRQSEALGWDDAHPTEPLEPLAR